MKPSLIESWVLLALITQIFAQEKKSYQNFDGNSIPGANVLTRQSRGLLKLILMESILLLQNQGKF
jgi:hypothetical protein